MSPPGAAPAQPSLRRLQRFGVRPDRELGQNFLIDSNILGVIGREAALRRPDVVLEVGGGLGVLSEYLAERVAHLHVVEVDERLREALGDALAGRENVSLWWADAMRLDLGALRARARQGRGQPPLRDRGRLRPALDRRSSRRCGLWVVMVQREVGERLAAGPGSGAYGLPSVLAQLACEVRVVRAIPRTVFYPVPNVDSVLLRLTRRAAGAEEPGRAAPTRERCARSWRRASPTGARRWSARCAWRTAARTRSGGSASACGRRSARSGWQPDVRAERLSPEQFLQLARKLER